MGGQSCSSMMPSCCKSDVGDQKEVDLMRGIRDSTTDKEREQEVEATALFKKYSPNNAVAIQNNPVLA